MDRADDATGGSADGQQLTAGASNIASITDNGSEVVRTDPQVIDEFESDSKWEITTLEKASYDCSDMYAEASPDQQNSAQTSESASDTNQSADSMNKPDDSQDATKITDVQESNIPCSKVENVSQDTTDTKDAQEVDAGQCQEVTVPPKDKLKDNTKEDSLCPVKTNADDIKQPQNSDDYKEYANHEYEAKDEINNDNIVSNDKLDSLVSQNQQDDGTFVLNQTAVDPQMEKMIDNIVEHGGCQQFVETLQKQAEQIDKDKEGDVENMQTDISNSGRHLVKGDESSKSNKKDTQADVSVNESEMIERGLSSADDNVSLEDQESKQPILENRLRQDIKKPLTACASAPEAVFAKPISQDEGQSSGNDDFKTNEESKACADETVRSPKNKKVFEDNIEEDSEGDKRLENKKSLPDRPIRQARLRASKRPASPEPLSKEAPEKRRKFKEPEAIHEKPTKQRLVIKVPIPSRTSASVRKTIATSAPSTAPETKKLAEASFNDFECKKYRCEKCKYSTDRLNNIVHHKKSACSFFQQHYADHVAAQVESWKRSIQSPKSNNKRSAR